MRTPYPKPRPQKGLHFTTKNVSTHSGCSSFWRSFVSTFGPRSEAHVSGMGAGPRKERYQAQGRRNIGPGKPMFSDSGHRASHMVLCMRHGAVLGPVWQSELVAGVFVERSCLQAYATSRKAVLHVSACAVKVQLMLSTTSSSHLQQVA